MSALIPDDELNFIADTVAGRIGYLSLHCGSPGFDGSNDSGSSWMIPTFTAAGAEGVLGSVSQPATVGVAWSDEVIFTVVAGTYTHWGAWDGTGAIYRLGNVLVGGSQVKIDDDSLPLSIGIGEVFGD